MADNKDQLESVVIWLGALAVFAVIGGLLGYGFCGNARAICLGVAAGMTFTVLFVSVR